MTTPLFSIIIPAYNAAACIGPCLRSLVQQSYAHYEVRVMDGGSTDDTVAQVQAMAQQYPHLHVHSQPDRGIYDAMNKGMVVAQGTWLLFLGADDYLVDTEVLAKAATQVHTHARADVVYGQVYHEKLQRLYDGPFDAVKLLQHNMPHQAMLFKKDTLLQHGAYPLRYPIEADYERNLFGMLTGSWQFAYMPLTVAFHAAGGVSATRRDAQLVADFPALCRRYIMQGQRPWGQKLYLLARLALKVVQRYGPLARP